MEKGNGFARVYTMTEVFDTRSHVETIHYAEEANKITSSVKRVKGASALLQLSNFDIVKSFVPEYMHSTLLGVTRQFINIWTDTSNHNEAYYIRDLLAIDQMMKRIKKNHHMRLKGCLNL